MDQNDASGFARNHRTKHVADRKSRRTFLFCFALRSDGIRGFTGLADANRQSFRVQNRIAIAEFTAVIHFDGKTRQALDHEFARERGVPTGAAGHDADILKLAELPFMIERLARLPVEVDNGSEFRYRDPILDAKTLTV